MRVALTLFHIVLSIFLITVIILQPRKQTRNSGVFGGGTQADLSGNQWKRFSALSKLTVICASLFLLTSVILVKM